MLLGPIFRVELVSVARRRRYFVLRVLYAALILFVLWATYSSSYYISTGTGRQSIRYAATLAASFFLSFSWLQILAILFVGPAMAAGTIASERERRTIEYLFATDLSNAEIVLGKTFARLTLLGQFVLVGLPILFLFRLLGGIPAEALLVTFLSAAGTAVMLTGMSIAVSVWSPKARDAVGRIYLLLIALISLPPILYGLQSARVFPDSVWQSILEPVVNWLVMLNPMSTLMHAMGSTSALGIGIDMSQVLRAVGFQVLVAVGCLILATFAVRRVHLSETTRTAAKLAKLPVQRSRRLPGERPMIWKEMYSSTSATRMGRVGCVAMFIILFGMLAAAIWVFLQAITATEDWQRNNYFEFLAGLTGYLGCGMLLLLAARAAGLFSQEKERDTWISLLSTPLSGQEIILGKLCGNLYSARWMLAILAVSWLLGLFLDPTSIWPMLATCFVFSLLACYATCLGLLFSLRSTTTLRAMGLTLGTLVFFGGGYLFCCCTVMASGGGGDAWAIMLALCIPFLLVFPNIAFMTIGGSEFWTDGAMPVAFVMGMVCHLLATFALYGHMVGYFDSYAGRTTSRPQGLNNLG
ncbi:MAG: ABC transporter permease subunit [Bythopirellula sp.]|nr:ABC transporter permease subunit [Bythopirellula sp.]